MITQRLQAHVDTLKQKGLYRQRQLVSKTGPCVQFSSNDYLSLSNHHPIKRAYQAGFMQYPAGSGGSMLVCGYHPIHKILEDTVAEALHADAALLFSSGYAANLSVMRLLNTVNIHIVLDKSMHASVYDGLPAARTAYTRFAPHDVNDLSKKLTQVPADAIILTEGIFSMSGHIPPIRAMAALGHPLIVDEAHAFGVLGREGLGAVHAAGLQPKQVPLRVIPLGKACAASGALVVGDGVWIDALLQTARAYIYSTALSPALVYGILQTIEYLRQAEYRRTKLWQLIGYFNQKIADSPYQWQRSSAPIQQLQLGCPQQALSMAEYLRKRGIICKPMRSPTVSKQATGLRIILNYAHECADIDNLIGSIHAYTSC